MSMRYDDTVTTVQDKDKERMMEVIYWAPRVEMSIRVLGTCVETKPDIAATNIANSASLVK